MNTIKLNVKVSWWVIPYLHVLNLFCRVTNYKPDADRVGNFVMRHGMKFDVGTK